MYLQSLEMIGFKSFAPRTVLRFHRGVTAVVGPNGCGKSNILDAMRWVLGEQSAKALRGGEMADVIFSGTDSRQALGMAEVSLTFAECEKELGVEWNEVCITRRVFRDGKSEYFLNKAPCRLRDIHQLFMDTGVGRSAYSIMEQGKIDLILSSRPEDRRTIFEEAAGITKYKAQKKEALRKLEYTEANLLRVQDIIKEVRRQIGSLQRQAAKARRYQALMKDLRIFDTHLSHKNYRELSRDREAVRHALTQIEDKRAIHEGEVIQQETELSGLRARMENLDVQVSEVRGDLQALKSRTFSAESRIATNVERCEEARSLIERHRLDIAAAGEKLRVQQDEIEHTDQLLARMIEALCEHEASLEEHNQRVRIAREERTAAERNIQDLGATVAKLDARLGSLRNEISAATGRREASETRLRLLQGESEAAAQAVAEFRARIKEIERRAQLARLAAENAQAEQAEAQLAYEAAQETRQAAETALNAVSKEAAGIESRVEVLRQLQEQGEGFDEGTQAVLRGLDNPQLFKPAIHGALADHIQVEPRFIPAVEAALGTGLQTIIFKDTSIAELALQTLSGRRLGKATISPREWISQPAHASGGPRRDVVLDASSSSPDQAEAGQRVLPDGAIAWAAACVVGEGEGGALASRLLDGVVIAENLEAAFCVKSANPGLAVATLAGEFISREGVVRGGQTGEKTSHSALARRAQIAQLDRELAALIRKLESHAAARAKALQALEASQDLLLAASERFQRAQVESASIQNEQKLAEHQLADLEKRRATYIQETVHIGESLRASLTHLENLESAIAETMQSLDQSRARRAKAELDAQVARERENAVVEDLNEIRVRVATERQQQEDLNRQRGPMAARLAELSEILETRRADIAGYEGRIANLDAECCNLRESIAGWQSQSASLDARIAELVSARSEVHENAEALEVALRSARQQLIQLQEQKGRLEVRITQIEMRMENLRNHVSHRYQIDLEAFEPDSYALITSFRDRSKKKAYDAQAVGSGDQESPEPPREDSSQDASQSSENPEAIRWEYIEEIVADLTERIEAMGPVNLDAIQEYDELEQRQSFLEKQNADLVNSKAELHAVILKINRTTRELFADTFAKISENFQIMFSELFGGGRANLILIDESDPLESGIEIIAKPPGKQLQSVSLLSGGERTMTAVALLFAIYMVKPSPFCVLDEMDAPLDESNISRFIRILDRFVDQSQFVVITHNKRTISRADMLYGVTMEEHGVSKIVSVKFTTREESSAVSRHAMQDFGGSGDLDRDQEPATA
jgi:chromosome segregation protein